MAVAISQTADDKIWVNDTLVVKDMNNNWLSHSKTLDPEERKALALHLRALGEI